MTGQLRSISIDLRSFSKPSVLGPITDDNAVVHIKRLADQEEKMACSLEKIGDNAYLENLRGGKFPSRAHSFV